MECWWESVKGRELAQGDLLEDCLMPEFKGAKSLDGTAIVQDEDIEQARLIVMTQSCDLAHGKAPVVAMCPIFRLNEFEEENPKLKTKGEWEIVRRGKREGLHLLASPDSPNDNTMSFVVDFGVIVSLPIEYLLDHAESREERWRLKSPYLEHFSQAFARFFMRVGLPSGIAPFK